MKKRKLKKRVKIFFTLILLLSIILISILFILPKSKTSNNDDKTTTKKTKEEIKKEEINEAKLTLVGDFLFEEPFYQATSDIENSSYFDLVKDYFKNDDLSIGNMEVVIGNDSIKPSGTGYNFSAPESVGKLISKLDLQVLSTANNHSNDRSNEGINSTIDFFNKTNIKTVGTYKNKEDLDKYLVLDINNIKFGFLSYTLGTNITLSKDNRYKVNLYRDPDTKTVTNEYKEKIKNDIKKIKEESDVSIVLIHWGKEFVSSPNEEQKEMAKFLNEEGIDIIVGSHSHSIEPIEMIGGEHKTLIFYSLGNFTSADDDISRTGETYDNAYQFGLLSTLKVIKTNNSITINDVKAEVIVNYFDKNMKNFKLIPLNMYDETYEKSHFRYPYNFNKEFINKMYKDVIKEEYRQ